MRANDAEVPIDARMILVESYTASNWWLKNITAYNLILPN